MRLKVICTFLLCLFWIANLAAQLPHDFRSEQIFLGVAKTEWAPNDTIEANGIVTCLASGNIRPYSRYLYIELLDSSDSVMVRQKVGCDENGRFRARIPTVSVAGVGVYYVRAYTNLMRNFSGENFALQPVLIGKAFPKREKGNGVLRCSIYPEGGFLVEGQVQGIVASVTDYSGKAISGVKLSVVNDKGDTLCVGKARTSGLANLKFVPLAARHYKLFVTDSGVTTSLEIPQAYPDRMKLQCAINGNKLMFEVLNANGSLPASRLYLYDKANGLVLIGKGRPSGIVPLGNRLGVTTVFLTDSVGNVLSESSLTSKYRMTELPSLPDVVVKARVKRDEHLSTEKFYSYNYVGREKIEQYNYLYLVDILRGIPSVMVRYNPENSKNPWQISSNRGMSTLNASSEGLVILLDGSRVENEQKADVLQMSADEIETVELLRPWQALAYTWGAVDGAIKVTTRGADKSKVRSKGIFYTPFGLSVVKGNPKTTVTPGKYRLLMDVVSPTDITSFERDIVVSE